jgi:hypothetical protein
LNQVIALAMSSVSGYKVLLEDRALMIDDERHHARITIFGQKGECVTGLMLFLAVADLKCTFA